jgi:uncharacterized phage protein gp47/JayE
MSKTYFDVPNSPEQFGITLSPATLRKIDYSGLDFDSSRKAIYEYIKTYFPDQFNDFVASNGIVMLVEIVSSVVAKLSLRADLLANEATLPTAMTEEAVSNHLALINQKIRNATSATTDIEITLSNTAYTDLVLPAGIKLSTAGPNNSQIFYEVFKSPNDFKSDIIIPAGKRGIIAFGVEGTTTKPPSTLSAGGISQTINIADSNILDSPIAVAVKYGDTIEEYKVIFEPIERYGSNDKVVEVNILADSAIFRFGDDLAGKSPKVGSQIDITYRRGGGSRGRIGSFVLDTTRQYKPLSPSSAPVSVRFRNITPSVGGTDRETINEAKRRAPLDYSLQRSIVTSNDYAQAAKSFSHPTFGSVSKALATVRTGYNANYVDLYVLCQGPDAPISPSAGIVLALKSYINQLNVMTDTVDVFPGLIKNIDIDLAVVLNRNAEASVVKTKVEAAITNFFALSNWEMGQPLFTSNIVDAVQAVDGILYVDLYSPANNILSSNTLSDVGVTGAVQSDYVAINEIVSIGKRSIKYYYEKTI